MLTFRKSILPPFSGFERFYTAVDIQQRTTRNFPEHSHLHQHRCQNLSCVVQTSLRAFHSIFIGFQCHELRLPEINIGCQISQDIFTYGERRYKRLQASSASVWDSYVFIEPLTSHVLYIGSPLCRT
jgi:hypothetical protein